MEETKKSTFGLDKKTAGTLTYVLGWITGLIFLLSEKNDKDVKFNAMQSIIFFGGLNILVIFLGWIPFLGWGLIQLLWLLGFVVWLVCLVKTYQGEKFKLPVIGEIAEKQVNK